MVLARSDLAPEGHPFLGGVSLAATQHRNLCRGQVDRMETDASSLLVAGLQLSGPHLSESGQGTVVETGRTG